MSTRTLPTLSPAVIRRDRLVALASGFIATLGITFVTFLVALAGLAQVDLPIWVASLLFENPVRIGAGAAAIHLAIGLTYGLLYAELVEPRSPWPPAVTGLAFGAVLWAFAQVVAVPMLGWLHAAVGPGGGPSPGLLSWHLGPLAALASLIAHVVYGVLLAVVYGCHEAEGCRRGS